MQIYENAEEPKERGNDFFFLNRKSQNVSLPYRKKKRVWYDPKNSSVRSLKSHFS